MNARIIPVDRFPDVQHASRNGLLAAGGDLSPECLMHAYNRGIFPWYSSEGPILWWSPDPRCVIFPDRFRPTRSLRRSIRRNRFRCTVNRAFGDVIGNCAEKRPERPETWITPDMLNAYMVLHRRGCAHSVETWLGDRLVGGLYGVRSGRVFFGESMFSAVSDASKAALNHLANLMQAENCPIIDCQITSSHLLSLGAEEIPRSRFMSIIRNCVDNSLCPEAFRTSGLYAISGETAYRKYPA